MLKKRKGVGGRGGGARGHRGVDSVAEYLSLIVARVYPWLEDSGTGSPLFRWPSSLRHPFGISLRNLLRVFLR